MEYDWEKPEDTMIALLTIYSGQTTGEQIVGQTVENNGIGFNAVDAPILTSFAQQILGQNKSLSEKQLALARQLLRKYAKQLEALEPSILPPLAVRPTFIPPPTTNGILKIVRDQLVFLPTIYPSNQIKQLGFKWLGQGNGWGGAVRKSMIEGVERLFSPIVIDSTVTEWLEEQDKEVVLSDVVHKSTLFDKQKEAAQFTLKYKKILLGMQPGTGKTASSIFALNELKQYDDILVVCPLSLCRNWVKEIKKWINEDAVIWHGPLSKWTPYRKWVVTNYETMMRNLPDFKSQSFKVVIFDESIVMKNRKAKRSEIAEQYARFMDYVLLLSGSPVSHFLDDYWSQLHILDPKRFSSYWRFVDQYCIKETNQWGTMVTGNQEGAIERLKADLSDIYFYCSQNEIADIPDWIIDNMEVPMSKEQYKYYAQMEAEFLADLPDGDQILAKNTLSQLIRLIQFASNPLLLEGANDGTKWRAVEELLEYEQLPAIVWTQFIDTANLLSHKLSTKGLRVERLTGQTDPMSRQDIVDRFQRGDIDVIVAHPAVGKFGITLTRARTAIYCERSFNGDDYFQSLYRIKRIGTTQSPHVINLIATRPEGDENTVDHVIDRVLQFRKNQSLQLTTTNLTAGLFRDMLGKKTKEGG